VIFQHGSIPLLNRAVTGLSYMRERSPELAEDVVSLTDCGIAVERDILLNQLATAFADYFNCRLLQSELSDAEQKDVQQLLTVKYQHDQWNLEGAET
jgi:lipoate-protein ligase A